MATRRKRVEATRVACEVCLKEVPRSEAVVPEAVDYVTYFCGLDCYEKWKSQGGNAANDRPSQREADRRQNADDIRRAVDDRMQDLRTRKSR